MKTRLTAVAAVLSGALVTGLASAAPGALDPGFGDGGVVVTPTAPNAGSDFQNGLAIERNGWILVGGESDMGAAASGFQWRITRYKSNGALDSTFGTGGTVLTNMSNAGGANEENIWSLAVQRDGKIVAAGEAVTPTGRNDWALARYNPDGTLDASFGTGGAVTTPFGSGTRVRRNLVNKVLIGGDGRIVAGGQVNVGTGQGGVNFGLARYNPDGALDGSFGTGGVVVTAVAPDDRVDGIIDMAIDGNGKIVAAGIANMGSGAGGANFALARYNTDGTLDSSFGGGGIVTTAMAAGDQFDRATRVAIDADGKIVAGGEADSGDFVFDLALARYNPDGTLDASFGTGGKVLTNVGPGNTDDDLEGLVIQPIGKILVGGSTAATEIGVDSDFMVARYDSDGTLDDTFGSGGIVVTPTAPGKGDDEIFAIALESDAKLVASGECVQPVTDSDVCVARYKVGEAD